MKRIYLKPISRAINIEAEQMIAASGAGEIGGTLPEIKPEPASNRMYRSLWDESSFSGSESDIWK